MDDLIPNDGANYDASAQIPVEQEKEEREYLSKVENSFPVLNDLIESFEAEIAAADSLTSLEITSAMPAVQVQIISEGNTRYINNLKGKLEVLRNMAALKG